MTLRSLVARRGVRLFVAALLVALFVVPAASADTFTSVGTGYDAIAEALAEMCGPPGGGPMFGDPPTCGPYSGPMMMMVAFGDASVAAVFGASAAGWIGLGQISASGDGACAAWTDSAGALLCADDFIAATLGVTCPSGGCFELWRTVTSGGQPVYELATRPDYALSTTDGFATASLDPSSDPLTDYLTTSGGGSTSSSPDVLDRLDLMWWGVWAVAGLLLVLVIAPLWSRAWGFWR